MNKPKIRLITFSELVSKKICSRNHPSPFPRFLKRRISQLYLNRQNSRVSMSKVQQLQPSQNPFSILHVDAIEYTARRNIVSALGMAESAPKSVFVSIALINRS